MDNPRRAREDYAPEFRVRTLSRDPEGIVRQRIVGENPQQSIVARLKSVLATLTADKGKA